MAGILCAVIGLKVMLQGGAWIVSKQWWLGSVFLGVLTLLVAALFSLRDPDWRNSLGLGRCRLGSAIGWGVLGLGAVYGTNLIVTMFGVFMGVDMHTQAKEKLEWLLKMADVPWLIILPLVVFVGFWEETVFRGFLLGRVRVALPAGDGTVTPWQRDANAVVITALLFGIGHGYQGIWGVVSTTVIGVVFGGLTLWRKTVWASVFAHITLDGVTFSAIKMLASFLQEWLRSQSGS